jgi:hypothetical protein
MTIINPINVMPKHDICHVLQIRHLGLKYLQIIEKHSLYFAILSICGNNN